MPPQKTHKTYVTTIPFSEKQHPGNKKTNVFVLYYSRFALPLLSAYIKNNKP